MFKHLQKLLLIVALFVPWVTGAQTHYNVQVGYGTSTNPYVPGYTYYCYSFTQSIYTANEVGIGGVIDSLSYQVNSGGATRTLTIYMAEVSQTDLSTQVSADAFHQVFSGSVTWTTGWNTIALDTAFDYQDTGSLVIAVLDQTGSYQSGYPYYMGSSMSDTRSRYIYTDNSAYTLETQISNTTGFLPNIKLGITSNATYCANPSDLAVSNIDNDSAHFSWVENGGATSWEIIVSDSTITDFANASGIVVNENSYTITGLGSNVLYYTYVRAICDASTFSGWTNATMFRSACMGSTVLPYATGFEDAFEGMPNCWSTLATGTSGSGTFPSTYEYATNARNGNVYFEFESNSGQTEIAVLPQMDNINTLQFEFYASCMNTNFTLEVGVVEDDSIFVPVDTVALTPGVGNNWHNFYYPYTVYFDQYTGSGSNMAMRVKGMGSYTLMIDDISVTEIPNCLPPQGFAINSIGSNWVSLTWNDDNGSGWEIIYDTLPINPATTELTAVPATENSIVLGDLANGVQYTAYLRGDCGGDYSPWVGPLTFTPGVYNMRFSGTDTLSACGLTIYDDGGASGEYTTYANSIVVLYPSSEDSLISFSGTTNLYASYAHLRIYDGVGISGTLLWQSSSNNYSEVIPQTTSFSGPITISFNAGSYNYGYTGFEINTSCVAAPQCATVQNVEVPTFSVGSAYVSWNVSGLNLGVPTGYDVYCYDTTGALVYNETVTSTNAIVSGLQPYTPYTVKVRTVCDDDNYGVFDSVSFLTLSLGCAEMNLENSHFDTIGNGTTTYSYLPVYTCYNYSLTQQIYKANELSGAGTLTALSYMPSTVASPNGTNRTIEVYLAHIEDSTAPDFVYPSDLTLVYSGVATHVANEWCELQFDNTFNYNGTDNLLVMFRDLTGVYSCSNNYYVHSADDNASHYDYQDGSAYPLGYTGGYSTNYRMNVAFSFIECTQLASCAAPIVVVDTVSTDFIGISWGAGYQETSWVLDYRPDTSDVWINAGTFNANSNGFTNLETNVLYHFRVGALCGDTTIYTTVSARTKCGGESLPFIYGFENFPSTGYPSCWYKASTYSYGEYPSPDNYQSHGGSYALYMYSSSGSYSYIVLPEFNAPIDTLEINFWLFAPYSGNNNELYVGVMTDPENVNTFQNVGIVTTSQVSQWEAVRVRFNNYSGNGTRIAIMSPESDYVDMYIDDINVSIVSPCSGAENVSLAYANTNDAMIQWDGSDATNFEVAYGVSGSDLDSCTFVTSSVDSILLTNLSPNTQYDVYIRTICGDGDTSNWSNAFSFRTDCVKITAVPYYEGFENNAPGWSSPNNTNFYPCWYRSNNPGTSYYYPYVYNYGSNTGTYGLYWTWDSYNNFNPYITLPAIDTNAVDISAMMLSFWAMNGYSNYEPTVIIGTMTDPQSIVTFQPLDTVVFNNTDYVKYEIPLSNYSGQGEYIAILSTNPLDGSSYWYGYMDDITIDSIPSCLHVYDLAVTGNTSSSVSLAWNELASATTWEIAVDTVPDATPVADTTVTGTPAATINGLVAGTPYYFWVRSVCSATDVSTWEGPVMSIPGSWFMVANQVDTVYMCGGVVTDDGGPAGQYSSSQDSYVIIRPDTPGALVSVSGTSYTESTFDHLHIYDGEGTSGVEFWNDNMSGSSNLTFGPFVSNTGSITLYFHSDGSVVYDGFVVNVSCVNDYCPVSDLMLDETVEPSSNTLALTWTGSSTSYDVAYGPYGIDVDSATFLSTTTNSITIGGLDPITTYDVYVRGLCNAGDTGMWHKITLTTAMCENVTMLYNYDTTQVASTSSYSPVGFSYYNYGYVQTIIPAARLTELEGDVTAMAFQPAVTTAGSYYTNMTVWMSNVTEDYFTDGFILEDSAHIFYKVIDGADFSYNSTELQTHGLDTAFVWDGVSNILVTVRRDHGAYTNGSSFNAHTDTVARVAYDYNDNYPYDPATASINYGDISTTVGDIILISCGVACPKPQLQPVTNLSYGSVTLNWNGSADNYEIAIKAATDAAYPAPTAVTGNSFNATGLMPLTQYRYQIRAICDATEGLISDWVEGTFTTEELPCFAPTNLHQTTAGYTTVTLDWTVVGAENNWMIHMWDANFDTTVVVNTHPATVGGLQPAWTYSATVRALCGDATMMIESEESEATTANTLTCEPVTGLTVTNITAHSAQVTWNGSASSYTIEYGPESFGVNTGARITGVTGNSYTINNLESSYTYDVYVRAECEPGVSSAWGTKVSFTTLDGGGEAVDVVDGMMNLSIYPNPTRSSATVALSGVNGEVTVTVVDMNGRVVKAETMSCSGDCTKRMDVEELAQGAYFVRVNGENINMVKKLIVK